MKVLNDFYDKIYKENYARVFNFIFSITSNRSLSEDITQETFVRAYKNIESLRNESKISVWLNKIAFNLFLDFKREKSSQLLSIDDESLTTKLTDMRKGLPKEVEQKLMSECVRSKILLMPENYRAPLFLDIHGYKNQEIANILGCSLENVKIRLHRAREKMKEILGMDCSFITMKETSYVELQNTKPRRGIKPAYKVGFYFLSIRCIFLKPKSVLKSKSRKTGFYVFQITIWRDKDVETTGTQNERTYRCWRKYSSQLPAMTGNPLQGCP